MSHEPIFDVDSDVSKRLEKLDGEGLELYVADLLSVFKPLGWKVYLTKSSHDMGGDLILDNPDGIRYVIQAKHRQDEEKSVGLRAVQQAVAAKAAYRAQHSIAMSNAVDFSEPAVKLAKYNGTILWRKEQLQLLYNAAMQRDELALAKLGLEIGKPNIDITFPDVPASSPVPKQPNPVEVLEPSKEVSQPIPPPQPFRVRWLWFGLVVLAGFVAFAFIVRSSSPRSILTSKLPTDAEILRFVELHDQSWITAQATSNVSLLLPFRTGKAYESATDGIKNRSGRGCHILISVNAAPQVFVRVRGFSEIEAVIEKNWTSFEVCQGRRTEKPMLNGPFKAVYKMKPTRDGWKIVEAQQQ